MTFPTLNLPVISPLIVLVVAALVILIADLLIANKRILGWVSLVAVLGAFAGGHRLSARPRPPSRPWRWPTGWGSSPARPS